MCAFVLPVLGQAVEVPPAIAIGTAGVLAVVMALWLGPMLRRMTADHVERVIEAVIFVVLFAVMMPTPRFVIGLRLLLIGLLSLVGTKAVLWFLRGLVNLARYVLGGRREYSRSLR